MNFISTSVHIVFVFAGHGLCRHICVASLRPYRCSDIRSGLLEYRTIPTRSKIRNSINLYLNCNFYFWTELDSGTQVVQHNFYFTSLLVMMKSQNHLSARCIKPPAAAPALDRELSVIVPAQGRRPDEAGMLGCQRITRHWSIGMAGGAFLLRIAHYP